LINPYNSFSIAAPMTYQPPSLINRTVRKLAGTAPMLKVLPPIMPRADKAILRLSGGRTTLAALLTGAPIVMLTAIGAKSGQPRTTPLLAIFHPDRPDQFAVVGSNWGQARNPAWYFNLKANPRASCLIRGEQRDYMAREVTGDAYNFWWQAALDTYAGYAVYRERAGERHIPIMVLAPAQNEEGTASS
jgi:deazaflavin-dependent oxidoreductase (nitroreductase family)